MKKRLTPSRQCLAVLALALAGLCGAAAQAQTTPISDKLFGVNYWYFDFTDGTNDLVNNRKDKLIAAGIKLIRIGGNAPNMKTALSSMGAFDIAIDRINAMGMTPVLQVPMNLAAADINAWIAHFKAKGIKYWAIGNEPDPSANYNDWYLGLNNKLENGNNYSQFRDKFINLASAVKQADHTAVVIGPDFRQFFGTTDPSHPLQTYYKTFINDIGTRTVNGVPMLDVFAFHFYGYHTESENRTRMGIVQGYLDTVNATRASKLVLSVGEVNGTTGSTSTARPWSFEAGQFLVIMTKNLASFGGTFIAPWSVYESSGNRTIGGTDFSLFNAVAVGSRRSTMEHYAALALNKRDFYMAGETAQTSLQNQLVHFGMTDANGSTVMLMNLNAATTSMSYAARLNNILPAQSASAQIKFVSKNLNSTEWSGRIAGKSSLMFTFDGTGRRLAKWEYTSAISDAAATSAAAAPLVSDLTVASSVTGTSGTLTLAAVLPASGPLRTSHEFLVDGVSKGTSTAPTLMLDSTTLGNGAHQLVVRSTDADGNVDSAPAQSFMVNNPVNISSQLSWYASGLVYNRATQTFNGSLKLSNTSAAAVAGPIFVLLDGLPSGVTLQNASGMRNGKPYLALSGSLAAGSSVTAPLVFKNPSNLPLTYTPVSFTGNF